MTLYEMVKKLIGPVMPLGDSARDKQRLESMKEMVALADSLIADIDDVAYQHRYSQEHSVKEIVKCASVFMSQIKE